MTVTSKQIELSIKGVDLASKPIQEIGAAVDKLVAAVNDIVPASEKGEKNLSELTATAGQLGKALKGLQADKAIIESFEALSVKVAEAGDKLKLLQGEADAAKLALSSSEAPTKAMTNAAEKAASAATRQAAALGKLTAALETVKGKASAVGIDFNNLAAAQEKIDSAFAAAQPAYARVNQSIEQYALHQREAKVAAEATAAVSTQDAAKKEAQAAATAEATAMEQRFTAAMRQEGSAVAEAGKQHGGLLQSFSLLRGEGSKALEWIKDQRRELAGMAAGFFGLMGAIEAAKSGFESIEKLEGTKSILTQTFGAEGAGQQLEYVKAQADRLSLSYVDLARNYAKFSAAAAGSGIDQSQTRQIFETFAEAARVKNLSTEQQATIFGALDKIMAKDSVGATELFRKLSTDLPEAAAIFRKSIDTLDGQPLTTDQFERLLKSGKITAAFVTKFAADYRASFAEQLPEATHGTTAALVSFGNAWDQFKRDILEGGALDAFKEVLLKMTAFFRSEDGRKFASELADGAKLAAKGVGLIVENVDALKDALIALAAIWAFNVGKAFLSDLAKLGAKLDAIAVQVNAAMAAVPVLSQALALTAGASVAAFEGFKLGTWLNDNIAGVRQFGVVLTGYYITLFEGLKSIGKAAWDSIFGGETFKAAAAKAMAEIRATNADLKDQYHQAGKEPGAPPKTGEAGEAGASGTGGATQTVMTPKQKADQALLAQKALDDELLTAAKSLQTKLSEMRGALLKKDATDLKGYLAGVSESFKPLYAEIDKLKEEFPHNSQAMVSALTAQLNSIKSLTLKDAGHKFNEEKAKKDLQQINDLLRDRDRLIKNESERVGSGEQSQKQATSNISGINNDKNVAILTQIQRTQAFIASLPKDVQTKLEQTTAELNHALLDLQTKPATNVLKDIKSQEEDINQALALRNTRLEAAKGLAAAGLITTQQEKSQLVAINGEYDKTIQAAKDLIAFIQTTNTLTEDQRKSLDGVVAKLQLAVASSKHFNDVLYPATKAADDLANGVVSIASAFTKAAGQGHSLGRSFGEAWKAFKAFSSDFLLKIGEMILKQQIMNALGFGNNGSATGGGIAGLISGWIGSGAGAAASSAGSSAAAGSLGNALMAQVSHGGGWAGSSGATRDVAASIFAGARRFHSGGSVAGLQPDEIPIIAQTGEKILSRAEVKAGVGGPQQPQHIQVINGLDHEDVVRQGLAAPSNVKVIMNMIRANRSSLRGALA
jgi:hypothetical protein